MFEKGDTVLVKLIPDQHCEFKPGHVIDVTASGIMLQPEAGTDIFYPWHVVEYVVRYGT